MNAKAIAMPAKRLLFLTALSLMALLRPSISLGDGPFGKEIDTSESAESDRYAPAVPFDRNIQMLEPVVVTAPRIPSAEDRVPAAVGIVEKEDIQLGKPTLSLNEALEGMPGVFVQNRYNYAQDARISIRGFGAQAAFGVRGIQIYADGIPLTLPDGQSQLGGIDPGSIQRIEVMRGPISALYGNASGGVINIVTQEGPDSPFAEARTMHGEFGTWKANVKGGGQDGPVNYFFNVSRMEIDGYREHSSAESWTANGKLRYDLDEVSDLAFVANAQYSPKLNDPGGLTREQAEADPRQAAPLALLFETGEEASDARLGVVYRRALTLRQNMEAAFYYSYRDLENAIPFRFVDLDRDVFGGRIQYDFESEISGIKQQLFVGVDVQYQNDDRLNFDNVEGAPGETLLLSQEESVANVGVYLQEEIAPKEKWSVVLGGRYDSARFEIDDRLVSDGDDSGSKTFDQATGRFGLIYKPASDLRLYANIAESFETPTTTELVNRPEGGGGINPDIEPQQSVNYEVGLKGSLGPRLDYDAAFFYIEIEDELIAFRDATDRVFYRNAGESRRFGVEANLTLAILENLKMRLAYTFLDAEFEKYEKDGNDLEGNEVPGIPKHQAFGELLYDHPSGFYAGIDVRFVGEFFADDENTVETSDYFVADFRSGCRKSLGNWRFNPFFGIQNLFDESYNNNVRINARGGRYFEPAPGFNVYGGLGVEYQW